MRKYKLKEGSIDDTERKGKPQMIRQNIRYRLRGTTEARTTIIASMSNNVSPRGIASNNYDNRRQQRVQDAASQMMENDILLNLTDDSNQQSKMLSTQQGRRTTLNALPNIASSQNRRTPRLKGEQLQ